MAQCEIGMENNRFVANSIKFTETNAGKEFLRGILRANCSCMGSLYSDRNGRMRTALHEVGLLGSPDLRLPGQEDFDSCGNLVANDIEFLKRLGADLESKK